MTNPVRVFDGHNDVLGRLVMSGVADPVGAFLNGSPDGHIDLPRARKGGVAGGLFAVFCPSGGSFDFAEHRTTDGVDMPLPGLLALETAQASMLAQVALLRRILDQAGGRVALCLNRADIEAAFAAGKLAIVLHLEGAEPIDANFDMLEVLYAAGLRSLGPVWSRPNRYGHGVPFRFPSSPDTGPGLTDAGRDLVRQCSRLGMLVDLSHITEQGFWDVAKLSQSPLVATHSNAHALCPAARNLTDRQLDAIRDSDGMVGLNFATAFLRDDGDMRADTDIALMVRQLDYLIERLGVGRVGFGSDFDGAVVPEAIGDIAGMPVLTKALADAGYGRELIERLAWRNWIDVLGRIIG